MSNETDTKLPIAPSLKALKIGESVTFPVERNNVVRNAATQIGLIQKKKFECNISEDRTLITVTRVAMNELEKAFQHIRDNWFLDSYFPEIEAITLVSDLLEEYGEANDLPEGWWMEFGEPEDILARLAQEETESNK